VFAAASVPPKVLRIGNGPEFISLALQRFCDGKTGMSYIPPGTPWNNGHIESFNNRLRKECLSAATTGTPCSKPGWSSATSGGAQPPTPPLGAELPNARRVRCGMQVHPHPGGPRDQLNPERTNPSLDPDGLNNGDSPPGMSSPTTR
jgi:transposase InsO family protein